MRAIRTLCEEHQALRDVLDALELMLDCQRSDDQLDAELALEALEWFERFADGLHQDREELALFPRLLERAPEKAQDVLRGLMRWHADERARLAQMRAVIEGAGYGDACSRDAFTVAARAYIEIQRQHSDIEDAQLLPLARQVLTPDDDQVIEAEYERLERRYLSAGDPTPAQRAQRLATSAAHRALERQRSLRPSPAPDTTRAPTDPRARAGAGSRAGSRALVPPY